MGTNDRRPRRLRVHRDTVAGHPGVLNLSRRPSTEPLKPTVLLAPSNTGRTSEFSRRIRPVKILDRRWSPDAVGAVLRPGSAPRLTRDRGLPDSRVPDKFQGRTRRAESTTSLAATRIVLIGPHTQTSIGMEEANRETTPEFLKRISDEALGHRAVCHPYLRSLASDDLPDLRWALGDFGRHYHGYSTHFSLFLRQTIDQLTVPEHRKALTENLTEESGQYPPEDLEALREAGISPEWVVGVCHPELFQRFCVALDINDLDSRREAMEVICWREMFLGILGDGSPAQGVGALGPGTENVVSTMYRYFLPALEKVGLNPRDSVFFPLHAMVDDHHQAALLAIAGHYAQTSTGRHELIKGMRKALYLRAGFWDWLYARAREPRRSRGSRRGS